MILEKSQHKLVMVDLNMIFSLGGKALGKKYINDCERYNVLENKWELAPSLNEAKLNIAATTINASIIYVFSGFKGSNSNMLEIFNAKNSYEVWHIIKTDHISDWNIKEDIGCFQISEDQVMLFGGIETEKGCSDEVYMFEINKLVLTRMPIKLKKKEWFNMRTPVRLSDGRICIAGYFANDMHIYKDDMNWTMIDSKVWTKTSL